MTNELTKKLSVLKKRLKEAKLELLQARNELNNARYNRHEKIEIYELEQIVLFKKDDVKKIERLIIHVVMQSDF